MSSSLCSPIREILEASNLVTQRLQDALQHPESLLILHRSQWRCLTSSYFAVIKALTVLLDVTCSALEQDIMCRKLTRPLEALHGAVQEAETCMIESKVPSSSESKCAWLAEKAIKLIMSRDVVEVHLHHLLWTSSVVREQLLRSAQIDAIKLHISEQTRELSKIWEGVDAQDDVLLAQRLFEGIMHEVEDEPHHLASFILQKLSCFENGDDLPPVLWVDPEDLTALPGLLGAGGYGTVHEATWLGGRYAVKDFFYVEDDEAFGREANIQAQLRHPNLMPLICCSKIPSMSKCSLVMELMYQDLQVLMMQRKNSGMHPPFSLLLALDLMLQIAQGMEYLHNNLRIVHRDLKSSNILISFPNKGASYANDVSPNVHLKVGDFGMAKAKAQSSRFSTRPIGTYAWRAPELFEDEAEGNAKYTNKVDVYSFGMVCYEILTGKPPFEGPHIRRRMTAGERPQLPPAICPPALLSYLQQCWHEEPARRPTFTQVCRMLRYFKACILLQDSDLDQGEDTTECHNNWLLQPISTSSCTRIDDMLRDSLEQHSFALQRPHAMLVIPFEMYYCGVNLRQIGSEVVGDLEWDFTYEELRMATSNFSSVLKRDKRGRVLYYSGMMGDGRRIALAVKLTGKHFSRNLLLELRNKLRHPNIVPLYGWCEDEKNLLLVYEYMPNGNLCKQAQHF